MIHYLVVYNKKAAGNPVVSIQPATGNAQGATLQDVYPSADPQEYGVVPVPDEVVHQMTAHKFKVDKKGKTIMRPVLAERSKELQAVNDSALKQNILMFGEPYVDIKSVTDLADKAVQFTALNPKKGIIGLGQLSGYFTVIGNVDTGTAVPEVLSEEKNWEWTRDADGNITGMKLLHK